MICPGTESECDNPGCRHGGCQGRLPQLPLFQSIPAAGVIASLPRRPRLDPVAEAPEPLAA